MRKIFTLQLSILFSLAMLAGFQSNAQSYCSPSYNFGCQSGYYISNVTVASVNQTGAGCTPTDYTAVAGDTISVTAGAATSMDVTVNGFAMALAVWADLNSDGNFNTSGEMLDNEGINFASNNTFSFSITVPSNTPTGYYRLRVLTAWDQTIGATDGCATFQYWGGWQDYTLYVSGTSCSPGIILQPLDATRCPGQSDTFTVNAFGSNFAYQWSFNGVAIFNATNPSLILTNIDSTMAGNYTCSITNTTCTSGSTVSNTAVLTVNPLPIIYNSGPTIFCPGSSITLTSSQPTGNQWVMNGTNIYNATNQTLTASTPGIYTLVYTTTCSTISAPDTIRNYPAPTPVISPAGISGVLKICAGNTQMLSTTTDPNWSYQWAKNSVNITGATGSTYNATSSGLYTMTNTNNFGCTTVSAPLDLEINSPSVTNVLNIGSDILCAGGYKTLYANSSDPGATFQWQFNGNNIPGATSATYIAYNPGYYNVVSFNGCYVTSAALSLSSLAFPGISAGGPTTFCSGGYVKLNSSITDTAGVTYQWMKNGSLITNANATTYTVTDSGTYQVYIVIDSSCSAMSSPQNVIVYPSPEPVVITTGNGYTLNTTQVYNTYQWYWGTSTSNLTAVPSANGYSFQVITTGYYSVAVTDYNGCTATSAPLKVTVVSAGVNNVVNNNDIKLYPNPANSVLHISAPMTVNVSILSLDGRVVLQQDNASELSIGQLANGMYLVRITDTEGALLKTDKIIKE